jgi:phospholipase C
VQIWNFGRYAVGACVAVVLLAGCGGGALSCFACAQHDTRVGSTAQRDTGSGSGGSSKYIQHVIVVIQENRSFDNLFSTFPGASGATGGCMAPPSDLLPRSETSSHGCKSGDQWVPLKEEALAEPCDWAHGRHNFLTDYDGGAMDGFGSEGGGNNCPGKAGTKAYVYTNPSEIVPYWTMAKQYVLADQMFQTQGSGSFTAHQDLIAGGTILNPNKTQSVVDFPTSMPWGCDNKDPKTVTSRLIWEHGMIKGEFDGGPFPCFSYATLRDLLDAKSVSWTYYSPPEPYGTGALWNAFDAIDAVRNGPEWTTNIQNSTKLLSDISGNSLASVAWVVPDDNNSDHPAVTHDLGPSWVASIVNAIGESSYWDNTAIIVVWDDWGGFYDNETPPFFDHWGGVGFRVPMLIISPYAKEGKKGHGYISHTQYEFGSILKFIENVWGLGQLGTTDTRATSIVDSFDFTQKPRKFTPIGSKYSRAYFLHQKPSYRPVDSE